MEVGDNTISKCHADCYTKYAIDDGSVVMTNEEMTGDMKDFVKTIIGKKEDEGK